MDLRRPQGAAPVIAKPRRSRQRQGDMTGRLLPIAGLLFVVACQPAAPAGPMITLDGVATAGPVCPVVRDPPDPDCADRPVVGARILVTDASGTEVARTITGEDGTFSVRLPAGDYLVTPQPVEGLMGTPTPISVTLVAEVGPEPLAISYDTGIR